MTNVVPARSHPRRHNVYLVRREGRQIVHQQFSARNEDAGFTLIEVVVAMLIFSIIVTGFLYTLTASLVQTRDTRARIVAANLASQTIDLTRSAASVFDVTHDKYSSTTTVNGDTFRVDVSTEWISASGSAASCESGASTASLAYKRVTVKVTWDNMRGGPVYSDTAFTPTTKINDPTLGTVLVGVTDSAGVGVSGVTVTLSPTPTGFTSATTDSDGCAYLLKVPVDTYKATISKSGYVNESQVASPQSASIPVTAGSTSRVSFAYDKGTTFRVSYPGTSATGAGTPKLPTNLDISFLSTYGSVAPTATATATTTGSTPTTTKTFSLYPFASGYSAVAGAACAASDPAQWTQTSTLVSVRPDPAAGPPGGTAVPNPLPVSMGVIAFTGANGSGNYLTAEYVGGGDGDPGCAVAMKYNFDSIISSNGATIALPYGTWKLWRGASLGVKTTQITGGTFAITGAMGEKSGTGTGTVVRLDPRKAP